MSGSSEVKVMLQLREEACRTVVSDLRLSISLARINRHFGTKYS